MRSYFTSPLGYVFCAIFLCINAYMFSLSTLRQGANSSIGSYFSIVLYLLIILIPILTMKLLSEDRRSKTEQLILTSPVSLAGMVFAKFLSAFSVFGISFVGGSVLNFFVLFRYGSPSFAKIFVNSIGVLLIGAASIAIGVFISALTENQMISAVGTVGALLFIFMVNTLSSVIDSPVLYSIVSWISIFDRFNDFSYGILNFSSLLYYISICFVFLFLTVRVYEKRRWE